MKKIKKRNIKAATTSPSLASPNFLGEMRMEDLLDLDFFEKCFFGKKLSIKDQLIFRIYARELLELIKQNINRQIARKQRMLSYSRSQKRRKNKSKSPMDGSKRFKGYLTYN